MNAPLPRPISQNLPFWSLLSSEILCFPAIHNYKMYGEVVVLLLTLCLYTDFLSYEKRRGG